MKKTVLITILIGGIIVIVCIMFFFCFNKKDDMGEGTSEYKTEEMSAEISEDEISEELIDIPEIYKQNENDVDAGISQLTNLKELQEMDKTQQKKYVGQLLEMYEKSGEIINLTEADKGYFFKYGTGQLKGALGGVSFEEFGTEFN